MKKILLTMAFVLTALGNAWADDVTVADITVPKGGTVTLEISLTNDGSKEYRQLFQLDLELPKEIEVLSYKLNPKRFVNVEETAANLKMNEQTSSDPDTRIYRFVCKSDDTDPIVGTSGDFILSVQLKGDASLTVGDVCTGKLTGIEVTDQSSTAFRPTSKTFQITINSRVALDEDDIIAPIALNGVDVSVRRTIKADQLSTICLPFAMTEAQVKASFGDDVQLFDFDGYDTEENGDGDVVGLTVNFLEVDISKGMKANYPYAIKVSAPISEFTVDGVDIDPEEDLTKAAVKRTKKQWSEMIGTYVSKNIGGDGDNFLFLSNDKFWYTNPEGKTKIKAFRAYFDFYDVLTEVEEAESRIFFSISDEPTKIGHVNYINADNHTYNLNGQKVNRANRKGLYIKNGKKVVIK